MKKNINIAFITDDNFAMPTYIALLSMRTNKLPKSAYNIYILYSNLQTFHIENIKHLSERNFKINFIEIENNYSDLKMKNLHVTPIAITKFRLSSIFEAIDKILYLDGDIIVQGDLSELYETALDGKYAAVVKDMAPMKLYKPNMCKKLGVTHNGYFNSGVMLLNLKKMRQDNMENKLILYRKNGLNYFMDQDALNVCFEENVHYISLRNNFLVTLIDKFTTDEICSYYNVAQNEIFENSLIIHYCSKFKPWKCYDAEYEKLWNNYFQQSPYTKLFYHRISKHLNCLPVCNIHQQIVLSLTSYPARINTVHQTIYSLITQNVHADKIILWLAEEQFANKESDLSQELLALTKIGLTIRWYHDIKSFKKLVPALQKYPEAIIVTADDDVLYAKDWLEKLLLSYVENPDAIHCHRGHVIQYNQGKIAPYNEWQKSVKIKDNMSYNYFFTGVGGVLYPPHCLDEEVLNEEKFMRLCPQADDIWFWAMAVKNNTKIKIVEDNNTKLNFVEGTQDDALWRLNVIGGKNDIQLQNVLREYPEIFDKLDKTVCAFEAKKIVGAKFESKTKKQFVSYRFLKYIPIFTCKQRGGNTVWKIFGLPLWRVRKIEGLSFVKYYLFGLPFWEIRKKRLEMR